MSFIILIAEEYDAYIIVSFVNATLVLSIGETVEEVTDSGFLGTTPTLSCSALGEDALVQVHTEVVSRFDMILYIYIHTYMNHIQCVLNLRRITFKAIQHKDFC